MVLWIAFIITTRWLPVWVSEIYKWEYKWEAVCFFLSFLRATKEKAFPEFSWKGIELDWHNLTRFRGSLWLKAASVCGQQVLSPQTETAQRWERQRFLFNPSVFLNKDIQQRTQPEPQLPPKWPIQWFEALTKITVNPYCVLWFSLKS